MNTKEFEEALLKEKKKLEDTLSSSGTKNPKDPSDWETTYPDMNITTADKNDLADEVEEFDTNLGINTVLEEKLRAVNAALDRIKKGTYGRCENGGEAIEEDRLHANPAARTCMKHSV